MSIILSIIWGIILGIMIAVKNYNHTTRAQLSNSMQLKFGLLNCSQARPPTTNRVQIAVFMLRCKRGSIRKRPQKYCFFLIYANFSRFLRNFLMQKTPKAALESPQLKYGFFYFSKNSELNSGYRFSLGCLFAPIGYVEGNARSPKIASLKATNCCVC